MHPEGQKVPRGEEAGEVSAVPELLELVDDQDYEEKGKRQRVDDRQYYFFRHAHAEVDDWKSHEEDQDVDQGEPPVRCSFLSKV